MDETDLKKQKIEELLEYIEKRLEELEEEKEELSQYQEMDKDRRCLEYTIYTREQSELNDQLDKVEDQRRDDLEEAKARVSNHENQLVTLNELEQDLKEATLKYTSVTGGKNYLLEEKQELTKKKAQLELMIADIEESTAKNLSSGSSLKTELKKYDSLIQSKSKELETLIPKYEQVIYQESNLKSRYNLQSFRNN